MKKKANAMEKEIAEEKMEEDADENEDIINDGSESVESDEQEIDDGIEDKGNTMFSENREFQYELKVPKDRVAVLIGVKGAVKRQIEETTKNRLKIDSKEGDVVIKGKDAIGLYNAKEVIKAIARGFNPDVAQLLLKGDHVLEMISMRDYAADSKKAMIRLKGRVIGAEGKSRKTIEFLTESYICVYGKTISIIGLPEKVAYARKAIESLLAGSPHSAVYRWLEKKRAEEKRAEFRMDNKFAE